MPGETKIEWSEAWLGTSIENRRFVHRADLLRQTPAAVRFISAEPLLGPLVYDDEYMEPGTGGIVPCWGDDAPVGDAGTFSGGPDDRRTVHPSPALDLTGIDWLIVGGESGPKCRPMNLDWARDLRDACQASGTAYFLKHMGGVWARQNGLPGKGGDMAAWPPDLRVREMPGVAHAHA